MCPCMHIYRGRDTGNGRGGGSHKTIEKLTNKRLVVLSHLKSVQTHSKGSEEKSRCLAFDSETRLPTLNYLEKLTKIEHNFFLSV